MTTAIVITKDSSKLALVATMALYFETLGHRMSSRLPGCPAPPPLIEGTQSRERPDMFSHMSRTRPVLLDSVTSLDMKDLDSLRKRLYLFYTGGESGRWDFHLACYKTLVPHLKLFCSRNSIRYTKLHEI